MRNVDELFKATAASLWETMTSHSGTAGFRIPEYQRTYDWSQDKITRLLEDAANGFYFLTQNDESFTFFGTLILVEEQHKETSFDGVSLAVVDGQQRLTTLVLTMCALIETINEQLRSLQQLPSEHKRWLIDEANFQLNELYRCVVGHLPGRGRAYPFPRLIRNDDTRAREVKDYEYRSIVSKFLLEFSHYYQNEQPAFEFPKIKEDSAEESRFKSNFDFIKEQVHFLSDPENHENRLECNTISTSDFARKGVKRLFEKLDVYKAESDRNRALSSISSGTEANSVIRLLLFASYLMRCIVLTRVETDDENSAFDIFDALNTTGEPLTAIETLKPRVIQYESTDANGYRGSPSEQAFERIDEHLNELYRNPDDRQKETKELIVSYALYADGTKQPKDLSSQRKYLRSRFDLIATNAGLDAARRFVEGLGNMAFFRHHYWERQGIETLANFHLYSDVMELQLFFRFLRDMNTSLALPVAARYWSKFEQDKNHEDFLMAIRALTAFIVLRRSATGTTGGIDSDLRAIMSKRPPGGGDPLYAGLTHKSGLPSLTEFKSLLRYYLKAKRIGVVDKISWVDQVCVNPLAQQSKPLVRFLLLAAADQSQPAKNAPGLWTRKDVTRTDEREYLTFQNWTADKYSTVEHIAPESRPVSGWDDSIYRKPYTKHTLGNLVLLPQEENSSAGNSGWERKKLFYRIFVERERSQQEKCIEAARTAGFPFSKKINALLQNGERLHLLDPLSEVNAWNESLIQDRTENIASLSWNKISPWLFS
ncbi:MAG: DUF262 domain-containing HNH endonuclease family protein [Nitrospinae bacterium]|nr:DUF262 domain-containing HNH endonuclease family protein [Nitrospinota bacterium]